MTAPASLAGAVSFTFPGKCALLLGQGNPPFPDAALGISRRGLTGGGRILTGGFGRYEL